MCGRADGVAVGFEASWLGCHAHPSACSPPPPPPHPYTLSKQVSRGGMGASGHLDADAINLEELEAANKQTEAALEAMKAPEGTQE